MSYQPHNWKKHEVITAEKLNHIEAGIYNIFDDNVSEVIDDWLNVHPEATTTVQNNSITLEKLSNSLSLSISRNINQFAAQRIFRIMREPNSIGTQGITWTGNSFIFCGSKNNTDQIIIESDINGNVLRTMTYSDSNLRHVNDIAYKNDVLYFAPQGADAYICTIDYETLNNITKIDLSSFGFISTVLGIAHDTITDKIYIMGPDPSDTTKRVICELINNNSLIKICEWVNPEIYTGISLVGQGIAVHNDILYYAINRSNGFMVINLSTGALEKLIRVGTTDGYYPIGELESATFVDGQLYMLSVLWTPQSYTTYGFRQVFKTSIGGTVAPNTVYGQAVLGQKTLHVDHRVSYTNPTGEVGNEFSTAIEACMVYQALKENHPDMYLYISGTSEDTTSNEYDMIYLTNCNATISDLNIGTIVLHSGVCTLLNIIATSLTIRNLNCIMLNTASTNFVSRNSSIFLQRVLMTTADVSNSNVIIGDVGKDYPYPFTTIDNLSGSTIVNDPSVDEYITITNAQSNSLSYRPIQWARIQYTGNRKIKLKFIIDFNGVITECVTTLSVNSCATIVSGTTVTTKWNTTYALSEYTVSIAGTATFSTTGVSFAITRATRTDTNASVNVSLIIRHMEIQTL